MKKLIILCVAAVGLLSCGGPKTLYYWGGTQNGVTKYEHFAYLRYDKQTPEALCKLICTYEDMVTHPGGTRMSLPPGICAEYGYILLQPSSADIFASAASAAQRRMFERADYGEFFIEYGKKLLEKEIELYPESVLFIRPLIEKLACR